MHTVKIFALIFLAIYLILTGVVSLAGIILGPIPFNILQLIAIISGVLILVSVGRCCDHHHHDHHGHHL